ncbi:hypothetical protein Tco_1571739 [Tanacetum coccineum]
MFMKSTEKNSDTVKIVTNESKAKLIAYSWGQNVVSGIEAAWGAKKTENESEKGWEHFLGIKRWSVGMRLREVQRGGEMKSRRVRD